MSARVEICMESCGLDSRARGASRRAAALFAELRHRVVVSEE